MSIAAITTNYFTASKKVAVINQGWRKPLDGYLMINADNAFDETKGLGSSGVVIRESQGVLSSRRLIVSYPMSWTQHHGR
jgi:hypothetical protein